MHTRFWMSLGLTLLVLAATLYVTFVPQPVVPIGLQLTGDNTFVVGPGPVGEALPPGWQQGDVIKAGTLSWRDIAALDGSAWVGTRLEFSVERGGHSLRLPLTLEAQPMRGSSLALFISNMAMLWLFTALGLLLLWRGRRLAAAAVCLWCLVNALGIVITSLPVALSSGAVVTLVVVLQRVSSIIYQSGSLLALYLLADDLTQSGISAGMRRRARWVFFSVFSLYTVFNTLNHALFLLYRTSLPYWQISILFHLAGFAVPLYLLLWCYRHAPAEERIRIRWIWASMFMFVLSYLLGLLPEFTGGAWLFNQTISPILENVFTVLTFGGLTYAVLRHRLVALSFVVNRTLVYGIITALVVGLFAAVTSLIDRFAIGRTEGLLLQLLIPLSLGVTLNLIKKRLDSFVERLFFQRQYQAEARLSRFAKECGFIRVRDTLVARTLEEIHRCLNPAGVALYERGQADEYLLLQHQGARPFSPRIPLDDPALVSLRAHLLEADLDADNSVLGKAGLAFPLAVRGELIGTLVVGQRPAEQYTQKERALLANLSQQVASALHALQSREAETFVQALASGSVAAPAELKLQAQKIMRSHA